MVTRGMFLVVKACKRERGTSHVEHGGNGGDGEGEVGPPEDIEVRLINERRTLSAERCCYCSVPEKHCYFGDRTLNSTNEN